MKYQLSVSMLLSIMIFTFVHAAPPCEYDGRARQRYENPVHTNGCDYNWGMVRAQEPIVMTGRPHLITRDFLNTSSTRMADARRLGHYPRMHHKKHCSNRGGEGLFIKPMPGRTIIIHDEARNAKDDPTKVWVIRNPLIEMKKQAKAQEDKTLPADYLFRIPIPQKDDSKEVDPKIVMQDEAGQYMQLPAVAMAAQATSPNTLVMTDKLERPDHAYIVIRRDGKNIIYVQD